MLATQLQIPMISLSLIDATNLVTKIRMGTEAMGCENEMSEIVLPAFEALASRQELASLSTKFLCATEDLLSSMFIASKAPVMGKP
jgi:uroporphyrinogen-III decarboxylase